MGTIINFRGVDIKHGDYIEPPDGWMLVVERSGGGWVQHSHFRALFR